MKKYLFAALVATLCMACNNKSATLSDSPEVGDIVFHTAGNRNSEAVKYATQSQFTHCGIVVEQDSALYVMEVQERCILTPFNDFINRGYGSQYCIKRPTKEIGEFDYRKYLGANYDYQLLLNNNRYYGAELVYMIYKNDLGIELCQPKAAQEYRTDSIMPIISQRNIKPDQLVVSPADLYNSPELQVVKRRGDKK